MVTFIKPTYAGFHARFLLFSPGTFSTVNLVTAPSLTREPEQGRTQRAHSAPPSLASRDVNFRVLLSDQLPNQPSAGVSAPGKTRNNCLPKAQIYAAFEQKEEKTGRLR